MGTTSEKLTYLNTTKGLIKDTINLTGANILSTDTFRSYATKLKNGLVDIINNGIDTLYDNFPKVTAEGTEIALNNTYEAPLKVNTIKGDTTQEGTPTPDTPQNINVVTGNQSISVNGNNYPVSLYVNNTLIKQKDCTVTLDNDDFVFNATGTDIYLGEVSGQGSTYLETYGPLFEIPNNATTINIKVDSIFNKNFIQFYDANRTYISRYNTNTKEIPNNAKYVSVRIGKGNAVSGTTYRTKIIVYFDTQITTYTIDLGTTELCKIGNYQDFIKKSTGKNLFDGLTTKGSYNTTTGEVETTIYDIWRNTNSIKTNPNQSYVFSLNSTALSVLIRIFYYDKNQTFLSTETTSNGKFTTPSNCYYVNWHSTALYTNYPNGLVNAMIEEGSTATTYEPYGKVWYIHKETRKLELATNNMNNSENFPGWVGLSQLKIDWPNINTQYLYNVNFYYKSNIAVQPTSSYDAVGINTTGNGTLYLNRNYFGSTYTQTYWETNYANLMFTLIYNLKTPETTEITDTTLINQLEAIKKSYEDKTYINVSGNLPMILNASALEKE